MATSKAKESKTKDKKQPKTKVAVVITPAMVLERVEQANITLDKKQQDAYLKMPDDLGEYKEGMEIPAGYKKCGRCHHVLKFYLFNKNSGSKTNTSGSCKNCQKQLASKSYAKTKKKRNYKKYYAEHKDMKQEQARAYYEEHKDELNAKHKEYLATKAGHKVMKKAHLKRAQALAAHKGIPYTRELVLDRDKQGGSHPICYLCGKPIMDTSGEACHLDHVVSVVNGGLDCFTNIAAVHKTCNLTKEKDDRHLDPVKVEAIIKLAEDYIDAHPEKFDMDE